MEQRTNIVFHFKFSYRNTGNAKFFLWKCTISFARLRMASKIHRGTWGRWRWFRSEQPSITL